jgi:hypothetical protein
MASLLRRQLVNFALVACALVLGVVVLVTWGGVTTTEKETRELNVLSAWREDELTRIVIEAKGRKLALARQDQGDGGEQTWFIVEPFREEADPAAMLELLGAFEFARWVRRIKPEEVDRAAFGLTAPERTVTLEMGKLSYRLAIGKEAASPRGARYLEVSGQGAPNPGIVIISRELAAQLDVDADELRERMLLPYLASTLRQLVIDSERGVVKLRSADWGGFRFDAMLGGVRIDREVLDRVLTQLARTKAERFIEPKVAELALQGASRVTITMTPKEPKRPTGVLVIGGNCPNDESQLVALRRQPTPLAACVSRSVWPGLSPAPEELVDRRVFSAALDQVEGLVLARGDERFDMQRKGEGFVLRKPHQAEVDTAAATQRLQALLEASGRLLEAPDLPRLGLSPPAGRATLTHLLDEGTKPVDQVVVLGRPAPDGKLAVRREQDGAVLELSRDDARLFTPDASLVKKLQVLSFHPSDLRSIDLRVEGTRQKLLRQLSGAFELEQPAGFTADGNLSADLVDTLASLIADRWVADRDDGSFGLSRPRVRATIELEAADGGKGSHELLIGDATSGGSFAMLAGNPGVFVLQKGTTETLETLVLDRSVLMIDPTETQRIVLETGDRRVELEKRGASFEASGGAADLTAGRVQQVIDALSTLRAEAAVQMGPALPTQGFQRPVLRVEAGKKRVRIGAGDAWRGMSVYYARVEGIEATYVVARSKVQQILDAL